MDMKLKRALTQCTLTMMVMRDVQNTLGDYDLIHSFVEKAIQGTMDGEYDSSKMATKLLNPLWDFYMTNLYDGYVVTIPRKRGLYE